MLVSARLRHFSLVTMACAVAVTPATAVPTIQIDSAKLIQPPDVSTVNCPVDGHYSTSLSGASCKIKFRIRGKKTGQTDTNSDTEQTVGDNYGASYYKLITEVAYDSTRTYDIRAWLYEDDQVSAVTTNWIALAPPEV